jgi:hypothetical protein
VTTELKERVLVVSFEPLEPVRPEAKPLEFFLFFFFFCAYTNVLVVYYLQKVLI